MDTMEAKGDVQQAVGRVTRRNAQLERHHSTEDVPGALSTTDNDSFTVITRHNKKKLKKHQQQTKLLPSNLSGSMDNSVVDDAIEFVTSQGGSQSNYKDDDGVCMETQRQERISAPKNWLINKIERLKY